MDDPYRDSVGDPQLLALHEIRDELTRTRNELYKQRTYIGWLLVIAVGMAAVLILWMTGAITIQFEPVESSRF